jgi:peptidoglycan hydrolase-like protein with peptidoglycan-binding domain
MFTRSVFVALVSASLIFIPVKQVRADHNAAALLGGLIVGGIIVNEVNKNNKKKRAAQQQQQQQQQQRANANAAANNAQRAQNRQVQAALNYFGYDVGAVDGLVGRQTRAGISRYQSAMGFPADGRMDNQERDFLLNSKQRAEVSSNVPPYNTILATQGRGGLLRTYRNEQLGIATVAPTPAPAPVQVATQPATQPSSLPEFNFTPSTRSVSAACNEINILTAANGGVTSASRVTDAEFALNEQFCLARTHAIAEAATIEATIPDTNSVNIQEQCTGLSHAIAPQLTTLDTANPDQVISATSAFMTESGQPLDRLIAGAKLCLGVGYRTDDAEMALASAVMLASGGELGYSEIVSHQLREGFGTNRATPQKADEWMNMALDAMTDGGDTVLGQSPDRMAVLSTAMRNPDRANASALPVFPAASNN